MNLILLHFFNGFLLLYKARLLRILMAVDGGGDDDDGEWWNHRNIKYSFFEDYILGFFSFN